ncbi:MAG: PAS domain-containing sensor histidine kinase [Desulfobulbaceae bacterium]|nr:MAG: PAS domain-containing sensor histidine kinase [Desulfobulbaceae bacterium]
MSNGLPLLPIYLVDFGGSLLMIVLALSALRHAIRLVRMEKDNVLWTYILWLSGALVTFSISRSVAHVLKYVLVLTGYPEIWSQLSPFCGGLNSLILVSIAVLTNYYYNMHNVIKRIEEDTCSLSLAHEQLKDAHAELRDLNLDLEQRVEKRTRQLQLSEEKFRGLFESSKDMILFCGLDNRISDINESGREILGYESREEIIGRPLVSYFAEEEKWPLFNCGLGSQGHVKDFEVKFLRQDDTRLYLMITASRIANEKGKVKGYELIAKDLTHFKEVTDQLIQSENMASVGQLAAGVAHEINTPLGIILGYSQLLMEDFAEDSEVHEILATVEKQTKACKRIVADLLKFSRHSVGGTQAPVDINTCIQDVLSIVEHSLNMDHIYVQRVLAEKIPEIVINVERLRQVLVNMINNAHHAIGKEGIVGVWTRFNEHCQEVEIIIGDTGCGIPPEVITRIFDPFFTTKGVGKGTGLGLSVSFGIIRDHGGYIEVHSPPVDKEVLAAGMNTAFHVILPREPQSGQSKEDES